VQVLHDEYGAIVVSLGVKDRFLDVVPNCLLDRLVGLFEEYFVFLLKFVIND